MNFSIHIDDNTAKRLKRMAKEKGKTRNALIGEALHKYIESDARSTWSKEARELAGACPDLEPFENYRRELIEKDIDPFK